jgi:hypothetical protein
MFSFTGKDTIQFFIVLNIIHENHEGYTPEKIKVYVTEQKQHYWNPYYLSSGINKINYFTITQLLRYEMNGYIIS